MRPFRLLVDLEVVARIEALPRREREVLRGRLREIQADPSKYSDCTEPDASGRRIDIHLCGGFAIQYWVDHADRHIKVLDLHPADADRAP